ncbi:hypothetical protein V9T40_005358 [Parthenolecanium corni]|uniref:S-methyl-5'-thioadenosine phosphorylase n=1 Tax=Parthenolecanium corni TaxID=536013 RepID=A0AAN9Y388_9HEMI
MKYAVKIGIIGGSGLDDPDILENAVPKTVSTPFGSPSSPLLEGTICGVPCVLLARHGKKHDITPSKVNYRANIWALKEAGCTHVIVSSACGSLQENIAPGDLVIPDSFIDLTKHRELTFYNNNEPTPKKVVHIPMEPAFCVETRQVLIEAAKKLNINCHEAGTAVVIEGPRFSTIAESRVYRSWGAQLVNMTLAPEVALAKEAGLCYACVAMATDYDCWHESAEAVNVSSVIAMFQKNVEKVTQLIIASVQLIAARNWDDVIDKLKTTIETSVQSK